MGIVSAVTGLVGVGLKVFGSKKSASGAKRAVAAQKRQEELQAARERIRQVREARASRARILQGATNVGAGGSSAALGGAASVEAQLTSNLQFIAQNEEINKELAEASNAQIKGQQISNLGSGVQAVGSAISSFLKPTSTPVQ